MAAAAPPAELTEEEWRAARREGIGASEIAAICGLNPPGWATPFDVWADKVGFQVERPESFRMRRGKHDEPFILDEYTRLTGREVWRVGRSVYRATDLPFALCTPDAFETLTKDGVEAKSVQSFAAQKQWGAEGTEEIPEHYLAQVTWCMGVCQRPLWHVAALFPDGIHVYTVHFNQRFFETMYDRAQKFWRDNVQTQKPPDPLVGEAAAEWVRRQFPEAKAPLRQASQAEIEAAQALGVIRGRISDFLLLEEQYVNQLKLEIGEAEGIEFEGGRVTYKTVKGPRITAWKDLAQRLATPEQIAAATSSRPDHRRFLLQLNDTKEEG